MLLRLRTGGAGLVPCARVGRPGVLAAARLRLSFSSSPEPATNEAAPPSPPPVFLSDYLHDALYDPHTGYLWNHVQRTLRHSSSPAGIDGVAAAGAAGADAAAAAADHLPPPRPTLDFPTYASKWEYRKSIDDALRATGASWLSPFELFNPWYGHALGKYLLEAHVGADTVAAAGLPLRLVGPRRRLGSGDNAAATRLSVRRQAKQQQQQQAAAAQHGQKNKKGKTKNKKKQRPPRGPDGPPLRIFELGGGSGTVAADVLDYLRQVAPRIYRQTTYTIVNPRPELLELQLDVVRGHRGHDAPGRVEALVADFTRAGGGGVWTEDDCFVLGLDLFDNLPRDKVFRDADGGLHAAVVVPSGGARAPTEHFVSLGSGDRGTSAPAAVVGGEGDDLIARTVALLDRHHGLDSLGAPVPDRQVISAEAAAVVPEELVRGDLFTSLQRFLTPRQRAGVQQARAGVGAVAAGGPPTFVPTGAVELFRALRQRVPRHRLVASGFDQLPTSTASPGPELAGCLNPPLVSHAGAGDLPTYLLDPVHYLGETDIFFASDFSFLQMAYHHIMTVASSEPQQKEDGGESREKKSGIGAGGAAGAADINKASRRTLTVRSAEFATEHADLAKTNLMHTASFNPILDDFTNIQFLLGEQAEPCRGHQRTDHGRNNNNDDDNDNRGGNNESHSA